MLMASNLNTGVMVTSVHTGANHADVSDNGITEKYCYDNDSAIASSTVVYTIGMR
jgi:hypothetical protein